MNISKERLEAIICDILNWGSDHDDVFRECLVTAMDLSDEEKAYFDIDNDYLGIEEDEQDEEDNEEIARLKYLLNKEKCCPLDKSERADLMSLLDTYGYPEY